MKKLIFVALSLMSFSVLAGEKENFTNMINNEISRLKIVNLTSTRYSDRDASPACKRRYRSIYNKRKIRIAFALGYSDAGSDGQVALDYYSSRALKEALTKRCTPDTYFCGFRADRNDPDLLRKAEVDSTGENNFLIEIKLISGSLSGDDYFNISPENIDQQLKVCQAATNNFLNEIASGTDFVIYYGHSRDGGGPDFCPPTRKENRHVNYDWYKKNRPGLNGMLGAMKTAVTNGTPNKVIGMFSCSSQSHFLKKFKAVNSTAGYALTKRLSNFEEMMRDSYAALDSLIAQRCEEGFKKSFDVRGTSAWFNMFE
ncbi:MAG: hypothetical protein ACJ76H_09660 [Bacteriovoracaceae bacterium]